MRKLLILFIILSFCSVTSAQTQGPIMLDAKREQKERQQKEEAAKPWLAKLYEQFLQLIGKGPEQKEQKHFRKDLIPELFVQDNCEDCRKLERFFEDSKMPYIRYDVQRDLKGAEIYNSLGVSSMPLTRVGTTVVKGYDTKRIEELMQP